MDGVVERNGTQKSIVFTRERREEAKNKQTNKQMIAKKLGIFLPDDCDLSPFEARCKNDRRD